MQTVRIVVAEIEKEGCYLLTQRSQKAQLPLLWEFPGGRVREDESDAEALSRSLSHRIDARIEVGLCVMEHIHQYEGYEVVLVVYKTKLKTEFRAHHVEDVRWVPLADLGQYEFPPADQQTMTLLLADD